MCGSFIDTTGYQQTKDKEGLMESLNNTSYVGETERAKLRENKTLFKTLYIECA